MRVFDDVSDNDDVDDDNNIRENNDSESDFKRFR